MNNEYCVSDGTIETAEKIREYFKSIGVDAMEISKYSFMAKKSAIYYWYDGRFIQQHRSFPENFKQAVL